MEGDFTQWELKTFFDYDEVSGHLTWKIDKGRTKAGTRAGAVVGKGYRVVSINNKRYMEHHLIWLWMTGKWPDKKIDHKNRNPGDNTWENLRPATDGQNAANSGDRNHAQRISKRGVTKKVVTIVKRDPADPYRRNIVTFRDTFIARMVYQGQNIHLGTFPDEDSAHEAYKVAHVKYHGEFSPYYKAPELSQ